MNTTSTCTALIPARGGSKGIPNKNLASLAGRPLIAWTIEAARSARGVQRVLVSTDDDAIAACALSAGAEVPFRRPDALAGDAATSMAVVQHALQWLADNEGAMPALTLLLQPTSPLRTAEDIEAGLQMQSETQAAVVSVTQVAHPPEWFLNRAPDGALSRWQATDAGITRRQDSAPLFHPNGAIYLAKTVDLLAAGSFLPVMTQGYAMSTAGDVRSTTGGVMPTYGYVMPPERSLDIDTPWDLHLAELILQDRETGWAGTRVRTAG